MAYEQKDGGYIYKNDKKTESKHPDVKGSMTVGGVEFWLSGWNRTSKNGNKIISVELTPKEQVHQQGMAQAKQAVEQPAQADEFFDDDIPF